MRIAGIIPARMASTRFPNKPLARIAGMPMIEHVYHRSKMCKALDDLWVATCDKEIIDHIKGIGGKAVETADTHQRASDRIAEAILKIEESTGKQIDFVAMVQGDEPMLMPNMLDQLVGPVKKGEEIEVVNLISKIETVEDFQNPNTVKVVFDQNWNALYFSREPIPSVKKFNGPVPMWKQLGIILFSRAALLKYAKLSPTPLEIVESVDMNRFLEHGTRIRFVPTDTQSQGVDTVEDLLRVEELFRKDMLFQQYRKGIRR
jgi:3-deoxy-manno-octulosonate cytidylyltransferase (CMP-KDO synthetase)